jgi:hypothetical protein
VCARRYKQYIADQDQSLCAICKYRKHCYCCTRADAQSQFRSRILAHGAAGWCRCCGKSSTSNRDYPRGVTKVTYERDLAAKDIGLELGGGMAHMIAAVGGGAECTIIFEQP